MIDFTICRGASTFDVTGGIVVIVSGRYLLNAYFIIIPVL